MTLAQRNNVNVYTIDPAGLDGMRSLLRRRQTRTEAWLQEELERLPGLYTDFLRTVAGNTGGRAYTNTNSFTSELNQLFENAGAYYLIGYRSANVREDGRFRRVQVWVRRPGLTVRSRAGYYGSTAGDVQHLKGLDPARAAIAGLLPQADLPLSLHAVPIQNDAGQPEVLATIGIGAPARGTDGPPEYAVELSLFTALGELVTRDQRRIQAARLTSPVETTFRWSVAPGRYELRAAATAGGVVAGSVYGYVDVAPAASTTLIWGPVIGPPAGSAAASGSAGPVALGIVPTTRRDFGAAEEVVAAIQWNCRAANGEGSVTWQLRAAGGEVAHQQREVIATGRCGSPGSITVAHRVPLSQLSAGAYALSIRAQRQDIIDTREIVFQVR